MNDRRFFKLPGNPPGASFLVWLILAWVWSGGVAVIAQDRGEAGLPPPHRLISQVPSLTESLFALGLEERIVGVSKYCRFPARAQEKTTIGGFHDASYETIVALRPDWVAIFPGQTELKAFLESVGCRVYDPQLETFADVFRILAELGRQFEREEQAAALIADLTAEIGSIERALSDIAPKKVLYVVGREPGSLKGLYAVGPNNFMNEMLRSARATNVAEGVGPERYPVLSVETLLRLDPEIVLDAGGFAEKSATRGIPPEWAQLSTLAAVRNGHVIPIDDAHLTIPGPAIPDSIRKIALLVHGEGAEKALGKGSDVP